MCLTDSIIFCVFHDIQRLGNPDLGPCGYTFSLFYQVLRIAVQFVPRTKWLVTNRRVGLEVMAIFISCLQCISQLWARKFTFRISGDPY